MLDSFSGMLNRFYSSLTSNYASYTQDQLDDILQSQYSIFSSSRRVTQHFDNIEFSVIKQTQKNNVSTLSFSLVVKIESNSVPFLMDVKVVNKDVLGQTVMDSCNLGKLDESAFEDIQKKSAPVHHLEHILAERKLEINITGVVDEKNGSTSDDQMTYDFTCVGKPKDVVEQFKILIKHLFDDLCPCVVNKDEFRQAMTMVWNESVLKENMPFVIDTKMMYALFNRGFVDSFGHWDKCDDLEYQMVLTKIFIALSQIEIQVSTDINSKEITNIFKQQYYDHCDRCKVCNQLHRNQLIKENFEKVKREAQFEVGLIEGFHQVYIPSLTDVGPIAKVVIRHKKGTHSLCSDFDLENIHNYKLLIEEVFLPKTSLNVGQNSISIYNISFDEGPRVSILPTAEETFYEKVKCFFETSFGKNKIISFGMVTRCLTPPKYNEVIDNLLSNVATMPSNDIRTKLVRSTLPDKLTRTFEEKQRLGDSMLKGMEINGVLSMADLMIGQFPDLDVVSASREIETNPQRFKHIEEWLNFLETSLPQGQYFKSMKLDSLNELKRKLNATNVKIFHIPAAVTVLKIHLIKTSLTDLELRLLAKYIFYVGRDQFRSHHGLGYNASLNATAQDGDYCIMFTFPSTNKTNALNDIIEIIEKLEKMDVQYEKLRGFCLVEHYMSQMDCNFEKALAGIRGKLTLDIQESHIIVVNGVLSPFEVINNQANLSSIGVHTGWPIGKCSESEIPKTQI